MTFYPVILSGGAGSRLWPLSREHYPKPLIPLMGEKTLLQDTMTRLNTMPDIEKPVLVCNESHRYLVAEQLREIDIDPTAILLEPLGRDTAPALTVAALQLASKDPASIMVVMPADHVIPDTAAFASAVDKAGELANAGYVVTFGITPDAPETGYGYIRKGKQTPASEGFLVDRFVEKPNATTAEEYLAEGNYFWNGGIFVVRADTWLQEIGKHRPLILSACKTTMAESHQSDDFKYLNKEHFLSSPSESIDYAVMENTAKAALLPMTTDWSDVGSWSSIWDVSEHDNNGNVCRGDILAHDTENSLLISQGRCVATVGLKDIVVVETDDAVLVADKNRSQDVKAIVTALKKSNRPEYQQHSKVYRPWGSFIHVDGGDRYKVKRLTIDPGATIPLQLHHHRAEHWTVVRGTARITLKDTSFILSENESTFIPLGAAHELENPGNIPLEIIEVQSGGYLEDDDVVPINDILEAVS